MNSIQVLSQRLRVLLAKDHNVMREGEADLESSEKRSRIDIVRYGVLQGWLEDT